MSRGRRGEGKRHRRGLAVVACGQREAWGRCSRSSAGKKAGRSEPGGRGGRAKMQAWRAFVPGEPDAILFVRSALVSRQRSERRLDFGWVMVAVSRGSQA